MHSILYLVLLFVVIFFAVRLATRGTVDNNKIKQQEQIVYHDNQPIS